jgi:macrolide transport system ATP-binding/permease protein
MIELKNVSKTYPMGGEGVQALRDISVSIAAGEFVAIMGPSGSGKSTLLHILGFLDRPESGSYFLGKKDISRLSDDELSAIRNNVAGFVFQQFHLLKRNTALENVRLPLLYAGKRDLEDRALERIKDVGLAARASHRPNELSGGEQQRIAIARALVNDPPIIFADEPTGNLDTKSEEEIIRILEGLNAQGKTIIMVTHERAVAEHARRIIFMRDGKIVSDEKTPRAASAAAPEGLRAIDELLSSPSLKERKAEWADHVREAVRSILGNKMRSALSMLGILIGVGAVIAMLALGEGAKASIAQRLASMGSNLLMVRPGSPQSRGVSLEAGAATRFTVQDAEAMAKLPEIRRSAAGVRGRGQLVFGNKNWNTQIQGVGVDYETMRASIPIAGRFFTEEELHMRARVVLVGATVARELYAGENPVGTILKINRVNFKVLGVLPAKGSSGWSDDDDVVLIPLTTAMYRLLGKQYVDSIDVEVKEPLLMAAAEDSVRKLIIKRLRLTGESKDSFQIRNMADLQETLASTTKTMTMLLGSIAAISLLVGGIGIMNIMLVSVTERTKEIGLRKALGARKSDIISQFLVEAVVMTFGGGVIGILFGCGTAWTLSAVAGWATKISPVSVILATTFSIVVGLLFGLWPARKAAELNPIQALRFE